MAPRKKSAASRRSTAAQKAKHVKETLDRVNRTPDSDLPPRERRQRVIFEAGVNRDVNKDDHLPSTPIAQSSNVSKRPQLRLKFTNIPKTVLSSAQSTPQVMPPSSPVAPSFDITISLSLYVNGKPKATPPFSKVSRDSLKLNAIWSTLEPYYKKETEPVEPTSQTIHCTIRCLSKTVRKQVHIIDDWTMSSCDVLLGIMDDKFAEKASNFKLFIELKVELNVIERNKLLKAITMSSPGAAAYDEPSAITSTGLDSRRAEQLKERHNQRVAAAVDAGGIIMKLKRAWACDADTCLNKHNYCYVEKPPSAQHYWLNDEDFEKWAKAIEIGLTAHDRPSEALFKHWVLTKGANGIVRDAYRQEQRLTQRELAASVSGMQTGIAGGFDRLMEMQVKQMERQMMADQKADEAEARRQRERDRKRRMREEEEDREEAERSLIRRQCKKEIVILPSSSPSQAPRSRDRRQLSPPARESSPIASDQDDIDIIRELFDWRKGKVEDERSVERLTEAYLIVVENQFSIDHLKAMSEGKGLLFEMGEVAGLPVGLMIQFRRFLKEYKEKVVKEARES